MNKFAHTYQSITAFKADDEEDYEPPPYGVPGNLLLKIDVETESPHHGNYEVLDYDGDTSIFWANEGMGFDSFFDWYFALKEDAKESGTYVMKGLVGYYHRGEFGLTDDEEEWEYEKLIRVPDSVETMGEVEEWLKLDPTS